MLVAPMYNGLCGVTRIVEPENDVGVDRVESSILQLIS
jgi:hypothetical protein